MKIDLKKEYLKYRLKEALKTFAVFVVFAICLFLLTRPQEAQAYEIYQGPPSGRFSDTVTLVNASGVPVAASAPLSVNTEYGSVESITDHYGVQQYLAPNGEVVAVPLYKLVGDTFFDSVLDPGRWTASVGTGGSAAVSAGQLTLSTGTTANNATSLVSFHVARFSGLAPNKLRAPLQLPDGGTANNVREWGVGALSAGAVVDGAFFRQDGTTLRLVTKKSGVETVVASSGAFNGQFGTTFTVGTSSHFYEVIYQPRQVVWLADNKIVHTLNAAATAWTGNLHMNIWLANRNTNGLASNVDLQVRLATIARFGVPDTQVDGYFQQGLTAGVILKYGPGTLRGIILSGVTNNAVVTLYDGTSTAGSVIWSSGAMGTQTAPFALDARDEAFNNGLFLTITGAAANAWIHFE